jgi:hypothetical protein
MLLKTYKYEDVEAAFARTNGISLTGLKTGGDTARTYAAQGSSPYRKGTGHAFAHVATYTERLPSSDQAMQKIRANQNSKSLWQNRRTAINACMELLNGDQKVRQWLKKFDDGIRTDPIDVIKRPLNGDYYGYRANDNLLMKATTGAINILGVSGELYIYSTYPYDMAGFIEPDINFAWLFGED